MTQRRGPLSDVVVVERAGRLAVAACAHLLAALGARVVRIETADDARPAAAVSPALLRLERGGKEIVALDGEPAERTRTLGAWLAAAEVVLLEPVTADDVLSHAWRAIADEPRDTIVCVVSPAGMGHADLPPGASDALVQAACGLMAVTGEGEERPEYVRVPVTELTGAVVALTSVLAALRVRRRDGVGQSIDLSLVEAMADQLRTHVGLVASGQTRGFRIGCRHPLCSPWNVYRASDGWVMICSASDANWRGILKRIGRVDLHDDERYARAPNRARNSAGVDALMQDWIGARTIETVVAAMTEIDVPAGPALDPHQVPHDRLLLDCGTVAPDEQGGTPRLAFRFSRSGLSGLGANPRTAEAPPPSRADSARGAAARLPLDGVRVVELTRYAAGPLAGYLLSSLGAEVVKVEPPGGEETRTWAPRFGNVSGYFANFNAGKRAVCLDLKQHGERERLRDLVSGADVLLHNMRPGAMERLGFGAEAMTAAFPKLVCCAISGYGSGGPRLPALDTVIQARVGLTGLIGGGEVPLRVGYSMADQLAGHFAAAGVLAALIERDASGAGQIVDVSMADAIAWLTHLAWCADALPEAGVFRVRATDGWVLASAPEDEVGRAIGAAGETPTRAEVVRRLAARGIDAAAVLEVDEVLRQPALRARGSVYEALSAGAPAPVFVAPFGLTRTPVRRAATIGDAGQDNSTVFTTETA